MSETELLNSVYILELEHYTEFCDLFKSCKSFSEQSLECTLHGFESIDLDSDEWLKHPLRKSGNILLFPFRHDRLGQCLTPWQIIRCWDKKTMVHCKWSLELQQFEWQNENSWKTSGLRKYLNSENFSHKFSNIVQAHVIDYCVQTQMDVVNDKFWLLSWEELGMKLSDDLDMKTDFETHMNSQIFQSKADRLKPYIEEIAKSGSRSSAIIWWLRSASATVNNYYSVGYVSYDGYVNCNSANVNFGCSPAFVFESGSHLSI